MIAAFTAGLLLGLSSGLAPGPLMMLVITQALKHRSREGIKVAAAPLLTDLPIILLSLFVATRVSGWHRVLGLISLVGALYILYLSYQCARTKPLTIEEPPLRPQSLRTGVVVNLLNPHPYLFWLTFGGPFLLRLHGENAVAPFTFLLGFYLLLVGSKVVLALLAGKSRTFLSGRIYLGVMHVLAAVLALFAFLLIKDALALLGAFR